ncbi:MAG: NAD-glutamate dehydrogenase [Acidobacteriota bacterium]|nr:NAD-glutamate dehydrogenase [Acidobacteriota bacterium]
MVIRKSREDLDAWLLDDEGIGKDLFGSDLGAGKKGAELDEYIEDIKAGARVAIDQSIAILTPWFFSNMPQFYYETTPREEKVRDLHAIITGHIFESKQTLQLWNRDRSKTTFLAPGNDERIFQDIAGSIIDLDVKHGAMFTSNDRLLLISSFFTEKFSPVDMENEKCKAKVETAQEMLADEDDKEAVTNFLVNLDHDMVVHATPGRMARLYKLYNLAKDREDAVSHLIPEYYHEYARLDIAIKKMPINESLPSFLALFERYGFITNRCVLATVNQQTETPISILTFIIRHESGQLVDEKFVPFLKLNKAAKSLRWVDQDQYDILWKNPGEEGEPYSLNEINLVRAMSVWTQIFLSKINPYYYSDERIRKTLMRDPEMLKELINYFRVKFDPRTGDDERKRLVHIGNELRGRISEINKRISRDIWEESFNFLHHIYKTNYFYPRKTGLAFRMDPAVLRDEHYPNRPFGFFYMVGRGYRGFQVRYRDTARGGMRIVMPRDASQYEVAFAGLFDEVQGLSYAQQLKNKDIPEGGSKAVLLLQPGADKETAAIGAVDSILNLITIDPETGKLDEAIIDYYGREEYIYLGPDENLTNDLIDAFVEQARRQGYRFPNAFMSSKPLAGINHKEYGVTSEGVNVFLENLLHEMGIDPRKQDFTVKMTGGPDGDVAGNELKILYREYGKHAKVVAIGDGLGAACDPEGLDWKELLRLVEESRSIRDFNAEVLSKTEGAFVIPADTKENIRIRNKLHAVVKADILIPAGGRPYTVNSDNWNDYLDDDDTPTVKGIVEGANIFFTEEARDRLQEKGVMVFKDSSANKCGVICSSFEIISSLILEPEEFIKIKPTYVTQVLDKLRQKADFEAKLLLREYHERGKRDNLVELSKVLSSVINRVTDLVSASLDSLSEKEFRSALNDHIILSYVPDILAEKYHERILTDIPRSYRQAMISADVAAKLVYIEGITFLENLADEDVVQTVQTYVNKQQRVIELRQAVESADLEHKEEILMILNRSGARTLTMWERTRSLDN